MKKMLMALMITLGAGSAMAQTSTDHWVLKAQGGTDLLLSSKGDSAGTTLSSPGFGFDASLGYAFNDRFILSGSVGYQASAFNAASMPTTVGASLAFTSVQLVGQFNFNGADSGPFASLGAGLAMNSYSETLAAGVTTVSEGIAFEETDLLLSPGLGYNLKLSDKVALFLAAKLDIDFFSENFQKFAGSGPGTQPFDIPQLYLPIQLGIDFNVR